MSLKDLSIHILQTTIDKIKKNMPNYTKPNQLRLMKAHLKSLEAKIEKIRFDQLIEENFDEENL